MDTPRINTSAGTSDAPAERRQQVGDRRQRPRGGRRITDLATHDEVHVTMRQVMQYLNVNRRTVLKWVENGDLPALKLGVNGDGEWRFKVVDLRTLEHKFRHRTP